ncbi:MAG: M48 family metallopeptidase [Candidatus Omnitrophica bacterium]|jgi:STE24 endopeptidase|nr:M48 family metallopeptidase [Candidatus Omnitrophota bacterium]
MADRARLYSRQRYFLSIADTLYTLVLLFVFLKSGLCVNLENLVASNFGVKQLVLPVFLLVIFLLYFICSFPLNFYRTFTLEHKFALSKQSFSDWLFDQLKTGMISYPITLLLISVFFYMVYLSPRYWWVSISVFWVFFSFIFARLAPVMIMPLFFKYKALADQELKDRIIALAKKMQVGVLDVFQIDLSKKSLKANAAFTGMGKTKRVLLGDTLQDKYSNHEIEVILAHEFAHYKLKHIFKLLLFNCLLTFFLFYFIFRSSDYTLAVFKLNSLGSASSVPLFFAYFILFGILMQPLEAALSRRFEKQADLLALQATGAPEVFISLMDKLATQNLADRCPNALIKFFFFDHPPIDERINLAKSFKTTGN